VDPFVITSAAEVTGPEDEVAAIERDAALAAIGERGGRCLFEERLDRAIARVLDSTAPGDLILLVGAQGMNGGKAILLSSTGTSSRTESSSRS
jgi:UDP-N-acetylmuramoyl-L-alanyl-D-glutamate--2,6-diaminopimelate ligase